MSADSSSQPAQSPSPPKSPDDKSDAKSIADTAATVESEELTPELVEEEAIRGDFMLRWSVILLALLLGWTVVSDTLTLVRIRSGEYMAAHGFLPPRVDVFSTAATDQAWVNLGWLGDLILAGTYNLAGAPGLTILAAVLAAVTFRLVLQTSLPGVSTWWGSLVAGLGVVACFPQLTSNSIWTLLGVALTCRLVQRFDEDPASRSLWGLVPCFWLWANLDRHMFVGLAVLLLWAMGRTATNLGLQDAKRIPLARLWMPVAAICVVVMLHPWHYQVWMSPWLSLGVELPEIGKYGTVTDDFAWQWDSMISNDFWTSMDVFVIFALVTAGIALLSMACNIKEVPFEHLLWFFGINGLAVAAGVFLPAATIVNVVIATLNGQAWYRRAFSQKYTVNPWALAYSRGGRAITVLAVFGMAYLTITGWLMGADGRRIGAGFEQNLASSIDSYEKVLASGPDVDELRAFNFRPEQGDVLIWLGYKPFVDRRFVVFTQGDENLLDLHRKTRVAVLQHDRDIWLETFNKYELNAALPRLSGVDPSYSTFMSMLTTGDGEPQDWYPLSIGAATTPFYLINGDPAIADFIENGKGLNLIREAFREPQGDAPDSEPYWPTPPTFTDRYVLLPNPAIPNGIQLARHYDKLLAEAQNLDARFRLAMAYLGIRNARRGLAENPNIGEGWRILSRCYLEIHSQEAMLMQSFNASAPGLRLNQAIACIQLARVCDPDNPQDELSLAILLRQTQQHDLAIQHWRRYEELTGRLTDIPESDENYDQIVASITEYLDSTSENLQALEVEVDDNLANGEDRAGIAFQLFENGISGLALRIIETDISIVDSNPLYRTLWGSLQLQNGQIEQAYATLVRNEQAFSDLRDLTQGGMQAYEFWSNSTALVSLVGGDAQRAIDLWDESASQWTLQAAISAINYAPLADREVEAHGAWGGLRGHSVGSMITVNSEQWVLGEIQAASAEMEAQRTSDAAQRLEFVLERYPTTAFRPLIGAYLQLLTDTTYELIPADPEIDTDTTTVGEPMPDETASPAVDEDATSDEPPPPPLPNEVSE